MHHLNLPGKSNWCGIVCSYGLVHRGGPVADPQGWLSTVIKILIPCTSVVSPCSVRAGVSSGRYFFRHGGDVMLRVPEQN